MRKRILTDEQREESRIRSLAKYRASAKFRRSHAESTKRWLLKNPDYTARYRSLNNRDTRKRRQEKDYLIKKRIYNRWYHRNVIKVKKAKLNELGPVIW